MTYCKTCPRFIGEGCVRNIRSNGSPVNNRYLTNELRAFAERRRTNNIMSHVAHVLTPAMQKALVTDFHELNPRPLGGLEGSRRGWKENHEEGISGADIPPCASCHGPDAKGNEQFPRLAGQLHATPTKLKNWTNQPGQNPKEPDISAMMEPIAHGLTEPQIKAVAAYVSYLE